MPKNLLHDSHYESCPTVELRRRHESKQPSPHQASCETRYRRSRPTILLCRAAHTKSIFVRDDVRVISSCCRIPRGTYPRGCPRCKCNCRRAGSPRGEHYCGSRSCTPAENCQGECRT